MKNASEWFRWLTPILLGLLSASNARIHSRMDHLEEKLVAYVDKVAAPLSRKLEEHAKEIVDIRVDLAKTGRRWGGAVRPAASVDR